MFHSLLKARWCTILMQIYKQEQKASCKSEKRTWYVAHEAVGELSTDLNCFDNPQSFLYMQHQNKHFSLYLTQSLSTHPSPATSSSDGISIKKDKQNCQSTIRGSMVSPATLSPLRNIKTKGVLRMGHGFACPSLQKKQSLYALGVKKKHDSWSYFLIPSMKSTLFFVPITQ